MTTTPTPDPEWLARQVAKLEELADLGLAMAREAKGEVCDGKDKTAQEVERLYLAYDRAARAVRLSILLQQKLLEGAGQEDAVAERKQAVRRTVMRIGERANRFPDQMNRLIGDRLDSDYFGDVMARPFSELVAMLCKDLGLAPNWSKLAEEGWAQDELRSGVIGWPLVGLAARPAKGGDAPEPVPRRASG